MIDGSKLEANPRNDFNVGPSRGRVESLDVDRRSHRTDKLDNFCVESRLEPKIGLN
jgi:hypothetical protein